MDKRRQLNSKDQEDQYGEDFESQSGRSSGRMSYRSNHSNINKDEGFFPSLKQSNNPRYQGVTQKGRFIPIGATSKDMQKGNDTQKHIFLNFYHFVQILVIYKFYWNL